MATGKPTGWVDAHVHVWTEDRTRYPRISGAPDYRPLRFTPEDFLAHARPNGVTRAVLVQVSFYGADNSYLLDSIRTYPGVFSGIAVIGDGVAKPAAVMVELARSGIRGFRMIAGNAVDTRLESAHMSDMWRCGGERQLPLCLLVNPDSLISIDRMCARFPDTPVVIDHLARIGADGVMRDADVRLLCALAKHPRVHVKVSGFCALGRKRPPYHDLAPMIRQVFEAYGPRRLMWGSDSPFQMQGAHRYRDSVALISEDLPFLSPGDREWLLFKTADSLLFAV